MMPARKLTAVMVRAIREEWAQRPGNYEAVAQRFGVREGTIWALLFGRTYRDAGGPLAIRRWRRDDAPPTLDEIQQWSEPEPNSGCWIWLRARGRKGYGSLSVRGHTEKAHRVAYRAAGGRIARGRQVLHSCDNPPCVNPVHLFLGTNHDNVQDRVRKGRSASGAMLSAAILPTRQRGESHPRAKLTWAQAREIRALYATGAETFRSLVAKYPVSKTAIEALLTGRTWKEATS